jgi:hypothetical protein
MLESWRGLSDSALLNSLRGRKDEMDRCRTVTTTSGTSASRNGRGEPAAQLTPVVLGGFTALGAFSIGLFYLPAAMMAAVARWPKPTTGPGGSRP